MAGKGAEVGGEYLLLEGKEKKLIRTISEPVILQQMPIFDRKGRLLENIFPSMSRLKPSSPHCLTFCQHSQSGDCVLTEHFSPQKSFYRLKKFQETEAILTTTNSFLPNSGDFFTL